MQFNPPGNVKSIAGGAERALSATCTLSLRRSANNSAARSASARPESNEARSLAIPHSDTALLARLLGPLHDQDTAASLAERLMRNFGALERVVTAASVELKQIDGVNALTASLLLAQAELANALAMRRAAPRPRIGTIAAVIDHIQPRMASLPIETAHALFLNPRNVLVAEEELGKGTVNGVMIYPREVARHALLHRATAVVLAHNHPSGDTTPSLADVEMTESVRLALHALDIVLHDHLIIGGDAVFSFRDAGMLPPAGRGRDMHAGRGENMHTGRGRDTAAGSGLAA